MTQRKAKQLEGATVLDVFLTAAVECVDACIFPTKQEPGPKQEAIQLWFLRCFSTHDRNDRNC